MLSLLKTLLEHQAKTQGLSVLTPKQLKDLFIEMKKLKHERDIYHAALQIMSKRLAVTEGDRRSIAIRALQEGGTI